MKDPKKLFSVEDEAALHSELVRDRQAAEELPEAPVNYGNDSARTRYYASAAFEPERGDGCPPEYREMSRRERDRYPDSMLPFFSILSGIAGGFFAVPAVFLSGIGSWFGLLVLVFLGPFLEETLKQSGAICQLEKMPGSLRYGWQFFLSGMLGGAVFSVLENLIYQHIYLRTLPPEKLADVMEFRWTMCLALHILCTVVSSLGLRRVWRESIEKERPCRIIDAFPWFIAATAIHGFYNASMLILNPFKN